MFDINEDDKSPQTWPDLFINHLSYLRHLELICNYARRRVLISLLSFAAAKRQETEQANGGAA